MIEKDINVVSPMLMTTIVDRGEGDFISLIFSENGAYFNLLTLGYGTANKKILSFLGLGEIEKDVIFSYVPYKASRIILQKLDNIFKTKKTGYGIAFCAPMNGVIDTVCRMGVHLDADGKQGGFAMREHQHDLIVAITAQGCVEEVMDVAKAKGASGGTVLRARGVGAKEAEKFFGITVQPEKDMIFIVVKKELRSEMINAIVAEKGSHTDAKAVVFSLPVDGIAGMNFEPWKEKK